MNHDTPKTTPTWEMESRWTFKTLESDFRDKNAMDCYVLYIIGKILERRCLKWARLLVWTFKTQVMAKRRARSQIGSLTPDHKKSRIDPIYLSAKGVLYNIRKLLTRATTLL